MIVPPLLETSFNIANSFPNNPLDLHNYKTLYNSVTQLPSNTTLTTLAIHSALHPKSSPDTQNSRADTISRSRHVKRELAFSQG